MRMKIKRIAAWILVLTMALTLCACGGNSMATRATQLVQGNMDELYLDKADADYLAMVDSTAEESHQDYLDGLEVEAEIFAYYFEISNLTDDLKDEIVELYKEIYSKAKYSVGDATKLDESTYAVKLVVSPLNIFDLVTEDLYDATEAFTEKYDGVDIDAMSDEEFNAYDREWAEIIINLCWEKLPDMGYMDEKSMAVQVTLDDDGYWSIHEDDFYSMDELIIYYP